MIGSMMYSINTKAVLFLQIILLSLMFVACAKEHEIDVAGVIGTSDMKINRMSATFVIDADNLDQVVDYSTYVFVADVVDYIETIYFEDGLPNTVYRIRVIENLKGELIDDEDITLRKWGGIKEGEDTFFLLDRDILPQVGKRYIFAAMVFEGIPFCGMQNTTFEVDADDFAASEIYSEVKAALKEENRATVNLLNETSIYDKKRE